MSVAIRIENVSKLYRLGTVGTGTLSHDLNRWWHTIRGKEDPYAKVGQVNDRTKGASGGEKQETSDGPPSSRNSQLASRDSYVWALKDINLEVQQGELLGIIGRNGAGKSTLLKLLSRVTAPTTGEIKTKGRIASLLEVGTGFHPELTGRENIYMNGSILGMRRHEITRQLDEIVEFSGCAKYLDTPVKRYSSGMTVRLGFAVAAHLQSEILIVDEVLAVGDAEFQNKCMDKMQNISQGGRTVLFVSHNMNSLARLCKTATLLHAGQISKKGYTGDIIPEYLSRQSASVADGLITRPTEEDPPAEITKVQVEKENDNPTTVLPFGRPWQIRVGYRVHRLTKGLVIAVGLSTEDGVGLRTFWSSPSLHDIGEYDAVFREEVIHFSPRAYFVDVGLSQSHRNLHYLPRAVSFDICRIQSATTNDPYTVSDSYGLLSNELRLTIAKTK